MLLIALENSFLFPNSSFTFRMTDKEGDETLLSFSLIEISLETFLLGVVLSVKVSRGRFEEERSGVVSSTEVNPVAINFAGLACLLDFYNFHKCTIQKCK